MPFGRIVGLLGLVFFLSSYCSREFNFLLLNGSTKPRSGAPDSTYIHALGTLSQALLIHLMWTRLLLWYTCDIGACFCASISWVFFDMYIVPTGNGVPKLTEVYRSLPKFTEVHGILPKTFQNLTVSNRKFTMSNQKFTVRNRRLTLSNRKFTVRNRRLTVNNRNITVRNQNFTVSNRKFMEAHREAYGSSQNLTEKLTEVHGNIWNPIPHRWLTKWN